MTNYKYPAAENAKGTHMSEDLIKSSDALEAGIFQYVRQLVGDTEGVLVDIGAGEGRYSQYFGEKATDIIAIEPDMGRLSRAKINLSSSGASVHGGTTVLDTNVRRQSADIVLNIHVLQHISHDAASAIINKAAEWLKPGGKLVLCFTKRTVADSKYNVSWRDGDETGYGSIPESLFRIITTQSIPGVLPVHKLDKQLVKQQLNGLGFDVIFEEDYTPRFIDLKQSRIGRLTIVCYKKLNPMLVHRLLKLVGYKKFVDTCIVAEKSAKLKP